jgi:DNA-binding NtrC family response regulator
LFYRLNVVPIFLPPLRERREDIAALTDHFLRRFASARGVAVPALSPVVRRAFARYSWPGNVRELENALERAVTLTKSDVIPRSAIPDKISERKAEPLVAERPHKNPSLDVIEQAYITWVLQSEGGNKTRAAEVLGIDPSTLYRKLSRYEAEPSPQGSPTAPVARE